MALLLLEYEIYRRRLESVSQGSQSSPLELQMDFPAHLDSRASVVADAAARMPSTHVCTVKRFRKQPVPSVSMPDPSVGLPSGDAGTAFPPPFKVMRPTPKFPPIRPSAAVGPMESEWSRQLRQGLLVRHPSPQPHLVSAFASRDPGLGTVPAPVPAPFGLAPRARIGGTDLAFGPVRHFTERPQSACGASAPLPRPDLLVTRSEPYRPVLEYPRPPPVFQSRGTYQVPSMANLDLAGHGLSMPGLSPLRGLSSGMSQGLVPQMESPAPQVAGVRSALPGHAPHRQVEMSGSTQSSRHQAAWVEILPRWQEVLLLVGSASPVVAQIQGSNHYESIANALVQKVSDTTARRYVATSLSLLLTLQELGVDFALVQPLDVIDAIYALRVDEGSYMHPSNSLKAFRWLCNTLELPWQPYSPLMRIFDPDPNRVRRESLPLPVSALVFFERILRTSDEPRAIRVIAGSFLVLVTASLRFSDAQHILWSSLSVDGRTLRGLCYRTKSCKSGVPFAALGQGLLGSLVSDDQSWPFTYLYLLGEIWDEACEVLGSDFVPDSLFFVWEAAEFAPMTYGQALRILRVLLSRQANVLPVRAQSYTLHSCKATFLSYMSQLCLDTEARRKQGHHSGGSVALYSRDDTHEALQAQQRVLMAVRQGWRPALPIARGAQRPLPEAAVSLAFEALKGLGIHHRFTFARSGSSVESSAPAGAWGPVVVPDGAPCVAGSLAQHVPSSSGTPVVDSDIECEMPPKPDALGCAEEVRFVRSSRGVYHVARADLTPACGTYLREPIVSLAPPREAKFCRRVACACGRLA